MSTETVAAVVVTFNRKQLLTECLDALLAQTRQVDRIFVIDNASSDGTPELLAEQGYLQNALISYTRLSANIGGAGGFHEGMKLAHEAGFDWLWVMDDDGRVSKDSLDVLLNSADLQNSKNRAPLVVSDIDSLDLTFGLTRKGRRVTSGKEILEGTVDDANIFGGNLFHRSAVECVGYPKKELFIWGDEIEYMLRLRRHNFNPLTTVNAIFYHPRQSSSVKKVMYGMLGSRMIGSNLKLYCFHRNMTFITREYRGFSACLRWTTVQPLKYIASGRWSDFLIVARGVFDGLFSIWGGETDFLPK